MESILYSLIQSNLETPTFTVIDFTDISDIVDHIPKKKIRHLVFSGGGPWGLCMYGVLSEAIKYGFVEKSNIQTIYSTSVGSMLAVMFCLNYEDEMVIQDYIVKRPWKNVLKRGSLNIFQICETYGIITKRLVEDIFEPLFTAVDLSLSITLRELYEYTGVEIHIFSTELNQYTLVDMSYKTHPDWRVCDAVYASCTVPILFSPIIDDTSCYLDGGLLSNYPVRQLINGSNTVSIDEVFGIQIIEETKCVPITTNTLATIEQFLFCIFYKIIEYFASFHSKCPITYEINIVKNTSLASFTYNTVLSSEYRENVIDVGKQMFREHAKMWWGNPSAEGGV